MNPAHDPKDTPPAQPQARDQAFRLQLLTGLLTAGTLAVLEMGPALAKKAYQATDFEIALLTSGQSVGLILSFFTSHLASRRARVPLVVALQTLANLFLSLVLFVSPSFALGFVGLHALGRVFWAMSVPAYILVLRSNFPAEGRGRVVGRIRQMQLWVTTVFALLLSVLLDWSGGTAEIVRVLGECPLGTETVRYIIPVIALIGMMGGLVYRNVHETTGSLPTPARGKAEGVAASEQAAPAPTVDEDVSIAATLRSFWRVWRQDGAFRRYESFFFIFGFANIMTIPLTQIHAVDELQASYFDLAMINVILVQGVMAATMVFWGRRVDLHSPVALRGWLNLIFSLDLLCLVLAPTIEWVYLGRLFRGLALAGGTLIWMLGPLWFAKGSKDVTAYTGIHAVLTGLRWAIAPFVGIALKNSFENGARTVFGAGFVVLVLTGVALVRESRRERGEGGNCKLTIDQ